MNTGPLLDNGHNCKDDDEEKWDRDDEDNADMTDLMYSM